MLATIFSLLSTVALAHGATYNIEDTYDGSTILDKFDFFTGNDPTNGPNYVSKSTAQSNDLVQISGSNFTLRADDQNVPSATARGRDSVRISSQKAYSTHVSIYNVDHMPKGCGTWPAIWEVGSNWPNNGEIDIVEGVNLATHNTVSLHTGDGCTVSGNRQGLMKGTALSNNCVSGPNGNTGCNVELESDQHTFGHPFNANGGGIYAMERDDSGIKVWFWSRSDDKVPDEVVNGADNIDTSTWGQPHANFPSTDCNINQHFGEHNIVINLTFCGDLAGSQYASSGCPSTCNSFVQNNPDEFSWAYFAFMWIKVYS
ncbi:glycoside hydrolase family 16 protein [Peniophora sp. CONT]|nr:glycoside hydrolase family 16 protein [Peniophora sp. CONT]